MAHKLIAGEKVDFEVSEDKILLGQAKPFDHLYHQSLSKILSEWNSLEDEEAYDDLSKKS